MPRVDPRSPARALVETRAIRTTVRVRPRGSTSWARAARLHSIAAMSIEPPDPNKAPPAPPPVEDPPPGDVPPQKQPPREDPPPRVPPRQDPPAEPPEPGDPAPPGVDDPPAQPDQPPTIIA